jgi:Fic family protein
MTWQYRETHPWITFNLDLNKLGYETWMLMGEAISKCEHIAGVPMKPSVAQALNEVYLSKSAHATTQIEGNTLSEDEVLKRVRHELPLPPSREYLGQEIDNIIEAYNLIIDDIINGRPLELTPERIKEFNRLVLKDLPPEEGVIPGEFRTGSVLVGGVYRGAPWQDCTYLVEKLCDWLEQLRAETPENLRVPIPVLSAIVAHLYIAWIHPFGNGNGRTARLIEFQLLVQAGVPTVAGHVLSNFYNKTRTRYAQVLAKTSRDPSFPIEAFILYAIGGFVDELREQINVIRDHQMVVMWQNFVHEAFRDRNTAACIRQRHLVFDLPAGKFTPVNQITELTPRLAREYANKTRKTVSRDLNSLAQEGLIIRTRAGARPNIERMQAFLSLRVRPDEDSDQP